MSTFDGSVWLETVRSDVDMESMAKTLSREVQTMLRLSNFSHVTSVYFGGGTPSLASPAVIESVLNAITDKVSLASSAEVTLEANPSSISFQRLRDFKAAGANRLSLGVQSLVDHDLQLLNRDHSAQEAMRAVEMANDIYDGRVNVDLIFGRPNQLLSAWIAEVHEMADLSCHHMSVYQLTVERGTQLYKDVSNGNIIVPGEDEMADMYEAALMALKDYGLLRYEISNFSRAGFESCHNLGYWQGLSYLGIGPAHSRFRKGKKYVKAVNTLEPNSWIKKVENNGHGMKLVREIENNERLQEVMVTSLRTSEGLTNEVWSQFCSVQLQQVFSHSSMISQCIDNNLLVMDDRGLRATARGLQVLDSILPICCESLQYINSSSALRTSHSTNNETFKDCVWIK